MLRVTTTFTGITGAPYVSTMHFLYTSSQANADAANAEVGAFWTEVQVDIQSAVSWSTDNTVHDIDVLTGDLQGAFGVTPVAGAGSNASDQLPTANQALVRWLTSNFERGRQLQGRTFIPAPTEVNSTAGNLAAAFQTRLQTAADNLILNSPTFCIWSRPNDGLVPPRQGIASVVVSAGVNAEFAVLRSRRD